jgi:hypothetical protein
VNFTWAPAGVFWKAAINFTYAGCGVEYATRLRVTGPPDPLPGELAAALAAPDEVEPVADDVADFDELQPAASTRPAAATVPSSRFEGRTCFLHLV